MSFRWLANATPTLSKWMRQSALDAGEKTVVTSTEAKASLRGTRFLSSDPSM